AQAAGRADGGDDTASVPVRPGRGGEAAAATRGTPSPAQFAALGDFLERYLRPDMPSLQRDVVERLEGLAQSGDIDVRALALASLHLARGRDRGVRRLLGDQLAALGDRDDAVRRRWVVALGFVGDRYRERGEPRNAITVYGKDRKSVG